MQRSGAWLRTTMVHNKALFSSRILARIRFVGILLFQKIAMVRVFFRHRNSRSVMVVALTLNLTAEYRIEEKPDFHGILLRMKVRG
ncbi:hypothetical protein [Salinicola salarius]|uniref:hypothetical protein n=1 Tax=Salinicola salarius TaxID=430457 RepID=UPI001179CAD4|nr:hypothetical protein [Salinicola salarius]